MLWHYLRKKQARSRLVYLLMQKFQSHRQVTSVYFKQKYVCASVGECVCICVYKCFCIHPDIQGTWLSAVQWLWYHYDTWQIKNVWINRILLEATVAGSHSSEGGETVLCRNYGSLLVSNYAAWLASNYSFHISEVTITVKNYKQDYFFFLKKGN